MCQPFRKNARELEQVDPRRVTVLVGDFGQRVSVMAGGWLKPESVIQHENQQVSQSKIISP